MRKVSKKKCSTRLQKSRYIICLMIVHTTWNSKWRTSHFHNLIFFWVVCVCVCIYIYIYYCKWNRLIDLVGRVFTNGPGDLGSIPGRGIPKTLKMVLDTSLLNTQQYKVCIKGKVEQFRKRSSALPYTLV